MGKLAELQEAAQPLIDGAARVGYLLGLNHAGVSQAESIELFKLQFGDSPTHNELAHIEVEGIVWRDE